MKGVLAAALVIALCGTATGTITITPTDGATIQSGVPLTVRCDFNYGTLSSLVSLFISKKANPSDTSGTDLVSIVPSLPNSVNNIPPYAGASSGAIRPKGQSSFLQVDITNPTEADAGTYECKANGADNFGRPITETATATVNAPSSTPSDPQAELTGLQNQLSSCTANLLADQGKLAAADGLAKKLAANAPQSDVDIVGASDVFDSKAVYLVTSPFLSYTQAQAACARHGGYIAEIDDEEEFQFVSSLLSDPNINLPSNVNSIITGAQYTDPQKPFEFITNKQNPVYTGHWFPGEPDLTGPPNTWLLIYNINNRVGFADGPNAGNTRTYVCEITQ